MITHDLTNEEYHKSDAISSSDVKAVLTSTPFHWRNKTRTETPAMALGTAVHDMVLEGGKATLRGPENRRGNAWKDAEAKAKADGKTLLVEADYDRCQDISAALMADEACAKVLAAEDAIREASIFVTCPTTGLELRCRPDIYVPSTKVMGDVKTTQDASPRGFVRQCYQLRYDVQGAFYKYVAELAGWETLYFVFLSVESNSPHATCLHSLGLEALEIGKRDMMRGLQQIKEAQEANDYSTGWPRFNTIYPPAWLEETE